MVDHVCPIDGNIEVGNAIRSAVAFTNALDNFQPIDPTNVFCRVTDPTLTQTTYEWGSGDGVIKKESVGNYYLEYPLNLSGTWTFRWYSTGNVASSSTDTVRVL